ncbi:MULTISPECIES: glycosyltransferase family 4 protein [unclassified Spirosoma]|uniref:glycosyltransferase family 4 protein n=1 Tax=unclassified Spirosoma TaxID=2621999 RepID=UPI0009647BCF|nr:MULTISPECIES: glycosyltransferase family 4 protein [unclassified Spirosoma]MBN8823606.1 glycosyltransferase family 4 protein [Spirosoma sp.]OJW76834.1 MAG: glycosyl transferase family 1 [Spirosoma sp. 48-14]
MTTLTGHTQLSDQQEQAELWKHQPKNVAFIGDYLPRQCGIATFTSDLFASYNSFIPESKPIVISVNDTPDGYIYPSEVRYDFYQQDQEAYRKAAEFLNSKDVDVVCLQHEYGIFGGSAGNYILTLLRNLTMPIITTFHTILKDPNEEQLLVLKSIADLSSRVICMSEKGRDFLINIYEIPADKIDLIPHGIPNMPFVDPHFYKDKFGMEGKQTLLTFGLLSPNKGIENVIRALPHIVAQHPNVVYMVLGATHPHLLKHEGEAYRDSLKKLAADLGVRDHVRFYNQFVELEDLLEYLGSADIYITPYLNPAQITSGTLSYAFGCGKAVVSTPYWHAEELLADGRGVLVPFGDSEAIADQITNLLTDEPVRHAMRKKGYLMGREMIWERAIQMYANAFAKARQERMSTINSQVPYTMGANTSAAFKLPSMQLDHLYRLTDSTGIVQHARHHLPFYEEGYCSDDNARALILAQMLLEGGINDPKLARTADNYCAFINHAYNHEYKRFRNFMSYDRRWLEEFGSDDSTGRTIWALGTCIGRSTDRNTISWAIPLLEYVLPSVVQMTSPRAWAFALLGIYEYQKKFNDDRMVKTIQRQLLDKLLFRYTETATEDWPWFENTLSYDNAVLAHALIRSGEEKLVPIGVNSLRWLIGIQTAKSGHFQPIGSNGFYTKGQPRAYFDQQPLEAQSTVSACLAAFDVTGNDEWHRTAIRVFKWFLGLNDLGLSLYDQQTGGCRDGLHIDRANQNQGAESTLSYLIALADLYTVQKKNTAVKPVNVAMPMLMNG